MTRRIIALSARFRMLVVAVALLLAVAAALRLGSARVAALPQFTPTLVQVQTEAPGLSAAEVEQLVTVPLEQDLLNGVPWLDQMRSTSGPGVSAIDLFFEGGTDMLHARQVVQERLTQARALPNVGTPPTMIEPLSSTGRAVMLSLSSKQLSPIELSTLARWKIRPRLMGIPGVANVLIWGQRDRQLQIQVDPETLQSKGVTLDQVVGTAGNALWVSPLTFVEASTPGTGGFIDTSNQRFSIQHVLPITTAKDLAAVSLEEGAGGHTVPLGDVSQVIQDHQPMIGDAVPGSGPGLMLVVQQFPNADTRKVTAAVDAAVAELRPGLSGVSVDTRVFRPESYLQAATDHLGLWALSGLLLFALLTALWLRSWRAALVATLTFATSLLSAVLILDLRGASFDLLTVAGLATALGVVVDEAVGTVQRMRQELPALRSGRRKEGDQEGSGETHFDTDTDTDTDSNTGTDAIVEATARTRGPALYATLIALLAPVPVLFLTGVGGALAHPLVLSYALAVAAAAVTALVFTPALASFLLPAEGDRAADRSGRSPERGPGGSGAGGVKAFLGSRTLPAVALVGLVAAGLAVVPQLSSRSLLPIPQDRNLLVRLSAAPGVSLPEMTRISARAADELRTLPGVQSVGSHVGRAVTADTTGNVNEGELWVVLDGATDYGAAYGRIERTMRGYPGLDAQVRTYAQDRLEAVGTRHGVGAPVVIRLYGQDLTVLRTQAEEVQRAVAKISGVRNPVVAAPTEEPTIQVEVNLLTAQRYGLKPGDVRRAAATVFNGLPVGSFYENQQIYDVVVQGTPATRLSPDKVRQLLLDAPSGDKVRLGDVASVAVVPFPTAITHDAASRSLDVTADVGGRDLSDVLADVRARVQAMSMPYEYHAEVLSDPAAQQNDDRRVALVAAAVLVLVLLLFQAAFRSWRLAFVAFGCLPLAAVGGVLTAFAVGGVMSVGALCGLLLVLVLAVRWLISLLGELQKVQDASEEAVQALVRRQVKAVGPTAAAVAVVLLVPAFAGPLPGFEVLHPLAVVALGGLVSALMLVLLVVPALFSRVRPVHRVRSERSGGAPGPEVG